MPLLCLSVLSIQQQTPGENRKTARVPFAVIQLQQCTKPAEPGVSRLLSPSHPHSLNIVLQVLLEQLALRGVPSSPGVALHSVTTVVPPLTIRLRSVRLACCFNVFSFLSLQRMSRIKCPKGCPDEDQSSPVIEKHPPEPPQKFQTLLKWHITVSYFRGFICKELSS